MESEAGMVDCSVGTIVWVRRRNGSWWPGKILGPEELSAAHLMSPRSGTPVKLLGREDASVDWYNLEKSKRVKAFRCGEFDDCIERAESSLGMPPKKREKYARREDAILHALELEKQLLEKKYGNLGISSNGTNSKSSKNVKKETGASLECLGYGNEKLEIPNSPQFSKEDEKSPDDESMDHPLILHKIKDKRQLSGDEDNSKVLPRMRGLQEVGLRIAPLRQVAPNGSQELTSDNNIHAPSGGLISGNTINVNIQHSLEKMKRTQEGLAEESIVRRRDKKRRLVQVLKSSTRLPVDQSFQADGSSLLVSVSEEEIAKRRRLLHLPIASVDCLENKEVATNQMELSPSHFKEGNNSLPAASSEENTSGSTEDTETDSSDTDSDSLETDTDGEMMSLSGTAVPSELEPQFWRKSEAQGEHGSMSNDEPDDMELTDEISRLCPNDPVSPSIGVSKWQHKGKRKNRSVTKRYVDMSDSKISREAAIYRTNIEEESNDYDETDMIENDYMAHGFGSSSYALKSKSRRLDSYSHKILDWEDLAWNDQSNSCLDPVFVGRGHFGGRRESPLLVEVDLKVQSSYQREHVPMISLMSKLNGQAIVGHPVQIEVMEDSASDILLSEANVFSSEMLDTDAAALPSMWTTARRTATVRVPRPCPSTVPDGDENPENFKYINRGRKLVSKRSNPGSFRRKKSLSHPPRAAAPVTKKFSRKPSKKISLSSSQKIRTLSSIATERKHDGGLIKPESAPGPAVACIPVKLVFSRLYEEFVGRHQ